MNHEDVLVVSLRAQLQAVLKSRDEIIEARDRMLHDLRPSLEAEIAARKLVEAKLMVVEAERDEARAMCRSAFNTQLAKDLLEAALSRAERAEREVQTLKTFIDIEGQVARAERAEATLAERTKERDEAIREAAIAGIDAGSWRRCADQRESERLEAEAALARVREALRNLVAKLDAIEPHVSNVCAIAQVHGVPYTGPNWADEIAAARAALTPAAPEPPKGDPRCGS